MTCRGWLYLRISTNTLENGVGKGSGVVGSGAEGDGHEGADGSEQKGEHCGDKAAGSCNRGGAARVAGFYLYMS
jgi:hypothetical protein